MLVSIARPELLAIADEKADRTYFGGFQNWYADEWHRRAGCGPTCAANILAYLALSRPALRALYSHETMDIQSFARHMEDVYGFVTPGNMGLNRIEMFLEGVAAFAKSRGVSLTPHVFGVSRMRGKRPPAPEFEAFAMAGLKSDCPLGFLNLASGREKSLQGWHWVSVVAADLREDGLIAQASDEGERIHFDLRLWYRTTSLGGGLVYFTAG